MFSHHALQNIKKITTEQKEVGQYYACKLSIVILFEGKTNNHSKKHAVQFSRYQLNRKKMVFAELIVC